MTNCPLYLDHAATTPVLPAVREAMNDAMERWANPSSPHAAGRSAGRALEEARARIAKALDWDGELIENGAFYLTRKAVWERHACRLGGKIALYEMAEHTMVELDSPTDWAIVTHLALEYGYWPPGSRPPVGAPAAAGPPAPCSKRLSRRRSRSRARRRRR